MSMPLEKAWLESFEFFASQYPHGKENELVNYIRRGVYEYFPELLKANSIDFDEVKKSLAGLVAWVYQVKFSNSQDAWLRGCINDVLDLVTSKSGFIWPNRDYPALNVVQPSQLTSGAVRSIRLFEKFIVSTELKPGLQLTAEEKVGCVIRHLIACNLRVSISSLKSALSGLSEYLAKGRSRNVFSNNDQEPIRLIDSEGKLSYLDAKTETLICAWGGDSSFRNIINKIDKSDKFELSLESYLRCYNARFGYSVTKSRKLLRWGMQYARTRLGYRPALINYAPSQTREISFHTLSVLSKKNEVKELSYEDIITRFDAFEETHKKLQKQEFGSLLEELLSGREILEKVRGDFWLSELDEALLGVLDEKSDFNQLDSEWIYGVLTLFKDRLSTVVRRDRISRTKMRNMYLRCLRGSEKSDSQEAIRKEFLLSLEERLANLCGLEASFTDSWGTNVPNDNAQILLSSDYEKIRDLLEKLARRKNISKDHRYLAWSRLLAFIFGYRGGVRRSEAWGMWDIDYSGSFLCVQQNKLRGVKTPSANRKLPVYLLMTSDELSLLDEFKKTFKTESKKTHCLFGCLDNPEKPISEVLLFDAVTWLVRQITGLDFRYHHLRHSFATLTYLRLSAHADKGHLYPLVFDGKGDPHFHDIDWRQMQKVLMPSGNMNHGRFVVLAYLMGHVSSVTSIETYTHSVLWELKQRVDKNLGKWETGIYRDLFRVSAPAVSQWKKKSNPQKSGGSRHDGLSPDAVLPFVRNIFFRKEEAKSGLRLSAEDNCHIDFKQIEMNDLQIAGALHQIFDADVDSTEIVSMAGISLARRKWVALMEQASFQTSPSWKPAVSKFDLGILKPLERITFSDIKADVDHLFQAWNRNRRVLVLKDPDHREKLVRTLEDLGISRGLLILLYPYGQERTWLGKTGWPRDQVRINSLDELSSKALLNCRSKLISLIWLLNLLELGFLESEYGSQ